MRKPDVPVAGLRTPVAVFVQVLVADHIGRDISGRPRVFIALIAAVAPIIEVVRSTEILDLGIQRIGSIESGALARMQCVGFPVAGRFAFTLANANHGVTSILTRFHTVSSRLENRECLIGSVDLKRIIRVQMSNAYVDGSRTELDLRAAIVQIEKGDSRIAVQIDHSRSQREFGARVLVGPELIARGHRPVLSGFHPFRLPGRLK